MKCDAFSAIAFGKLKPEERKLPQELLRMRACVKKMEENNLAWGMLTTKKYPPKNCVYLESEHGDCVMCALGHLFGHRNAQT